MGLRVVFLIGLSIGAIAIGLTGGPVAVKAMAPVVTVLIVGIAVRALIRIWWPLIWGDEESDTDDDS